jgi:O-antigen/teichoic acid export membrane protein
MGGTAGAQLIILLSAPILTRLYSPEDFGVLAVLVSMLSILIVLVSFRYELAIPIADDEQTALSLVLICLCLTAIVSITTAVVVWIFGEKLANLMGIGTYADYLWMLPIGLFLMGVYQTFKYWATRAKAFSCIAKTKLTQSIASLVIQLSLFKFGPLGLITGHITGQFLGARALMKAGPTGSNIQYLRWADLHFAAMRYRRFPIFTTWASIFNTSGMQLPILLFSSFFWFACGRALFAG